MKIVPNVKKNLAYTDKLSGVATLVCCGDSRISLAAQVYLPPNLRRRYLPSPAAHRSDTQQTTDN